MKLTKRELQIIDGLVKGRPIKQICFELGISVGTSKMYLYKLRQKFGLNNYQIIYNLGWERGFNSKDGKED